MIIDNRNEEWLLSWRYRSEGDQPFLQRLHRVKEKCQLRPLGVKERADMDLLQLIEAVELISVSGCCSCFHFCSNM